MQINENRQPQIFLCSAKLKLRGRERERGRVDFPANGRINSRLLLFRSREETGAILQNQSQARVKTINYTSAKLGMELGGEPPFFYKKKSEGWDSDRQHRWMCPHGCARTSTPLTNPFTHIHARLHTPKHQCLFHSRWGVINVNPLRRPRLRAMSLPAVTKVLAWPSCWLDKS